MFIVTRRCLGMSRMTTTFVRNISSEANIPKSNEEQLIKTINMLTEQVKSMQFEINCKFEALNTQMKTEVIKIKNDVNSENLKGKKEVAEVTDKIREDFFALKKELGAVKFYAGGLFYVFIGGFLCVILAMIIKKNV
ncbi:hypothetical protein ACQ4LE_008112 [Meloidogyne hapla]|uniref:Uncharacterized protein n=1 Tax=Meloidogyne hapla TaxID=6305 RepID=A0A1I8B1Z6_MELHA